MSFLTSRWVFKTPNWYLNQTFWWKGLKKHGKIGGRGISTIFFYFKQTQIMSKCKISFRFLKIKSGFPNAFISNWSNFDPPPWEISKFRLINLDEFEMFTGVYIFYWMKNNIPLSLKLKLLTKSRNLRHFLFLV